MNASVWSSVERAWSEGGTSQLLMRSFNRAARGAVECGSVTFFRRALLASPLEPPPPVGVTIHVATLADRRRVVEGCDPRRDPALIAARLRRGDVCFLAADGAGRVLHSDWVTTVRGHVPEIRMDLVPRPGEAYMYDAYTPPAHRGRRLFGIVLDAMFVSLRCAGLHTAYSYVRGDSPTGIAGARRRLAPVGTLWYVRAGSWPPLAVGPRGEGMPQLVRTTAAGGDDALSGGAAVVVDGGLPRAVAGAAVGGAARVRDTDEALPL